MRVIFISIFVLVCTCCSFGQQETKSFSSKDSLYNANIKKSKLYGVYIPRDIDDALTKLMDLTTPEARANLLKADEETIARKLHFGLGRWMEYNWNFAEGSRFSHFLRQKGLSFTDDMTRFMLITFHRHVAAADVESDALIAKIVKEREAKLKAEQEKSTLISTETKQISKNN